MAVAPPLQPFVKQNNGSGEEHIRLLHIPSIWSRPLSLSLSLSLCYTRRHSNTCFLSLSLTISLTCTHTPAHSLSLPPDPLDIDDGLYNFLSPQLVSHGESGVDLKGDENSLLRPHINGVMLPDKPEWFQKGKCTSILLEFILLSCVV